MKLQAFKRKALLVAASSAVLGLSLSAITPAQAAPKVQITWLVNNTSTVTGPANEIIKDFMAKNKDIQVVLTMRPGGTDGDNIVKTKLATKTMDSIFTYNTGALFQALAPSKTMVNLAAEKFQSNVDTGFKNAVSVGKNIYGAPFGTVMGAGFYYNKTLFSGAGITSTPKTWPAVIEAAKALKAKYPDVAPICASFGSSFTAQIYVLADYYNVHARIPSFTANYTAGKAKFASTPVALRGFQKLAEASSFFNSDKNTMTRPGASAAMSNGTCAMYPWQTSFNATLTADAQARTGFFAFPGDSAGDYGLTTWLSDAAYIPTTTTGAKLVAAKKLVAFIASKAGTDAYVRANGYTAPFLTKDQSAAPDTVAPAVKDLAALLKSGKTYPALEFLSPVKGPNLAAIMVDLGNQRTTARDAAARYDKDVEAAAKQLGLPGW